MPRYRKLYTKTLESLDVNDMPNDFTRLFWVLLPLVLCREGRGLNSPAWLRAKLFPLREDVAQEQVEQAFDWCVQRGMIVPYSVEGRDYFYVSSFHTYQGNTVKEAESDYPAPQPPVETSSEPTLELVQSKSGTDADAICNNSIQYSDATATAYEPTAVVAALEEVHELGIKEPKATALVKHHTEAGNLPELVPRLTGWIAHYSEQKGITNPVGLAIKQVEAGLMPPRASPDDGRRRYVAGKYADIIEH